MNCGNQFFFRRAILASWDGPTMAARTQTYYSHQRSANAYIFEASVMAGPMQTYGGFAQKISGRFESGPFDSCMETGATRQRCAALFGAGIARSRHAANGWLAKIWPQVPHGMDRYGFGGRGIVDSAGASCQLGHSQCGYLSDTWSYNTVNNVWTQQGGGEALDQGGVYHHSASMQAPLNPGSRMGASAWTDELGNSWLWGGLGYQSHIQNQLPTGGKCVVASYRRLFNQIET